jgi:hypothetical protein
MPRFAIAFLALLCCSPAPAAAQAETPKEMVILTVGGTIGEANRGPLDPKRDSLLAINKIGFKRAFAFDRAMLLGLPQGTVTAQPPEFDAPATFKGPLLREVLGKIEAAKLKITFVAVNGYTGWLTPADVDTSDWILALEVDGKPLGLGGQGPIWAINTRAEGEKASETHQGHWVWSIFYIHVGG